MSLRRRGRGVPVQPTCAGRPWRTCATLPPSRQRGPGEARLRTRHGTCQGTRNGAVSWGGAMGRCHYAMGRCREQRGGLASSPPTSSSMIRPHSATSSAVPSCGGGKEGGTVERHRSMMVQTNIQSCSGGKKGSCATHSPRLPGQTAVKRRGSAWKEGRAGA